MKIAELIAELQQWPGDGDVLVTRAITVPGDDAAYPIVAVKGFAGAALDGRDSGVSLVIPAHAYREQA
jgi:hypothetical protein